MNGLGVMMAEGMQYIGFKSYKKYRKSRPLWLKTEQATTQERVPLAMYKLALYKEAKVHTKNIMAPFLQDRRRQQMEEIAGKAFDVSLYEKDLNRNFVIGLSAIGLTAAGSAIHPLFTLMGLPLILYLFFYFRNEDQIR